MACSDCGGPLGRKNTSGYCRSCIGRAVWKREGHREAHSSAIKRAIWSDPERLERYRAAARAASSSPAAVKARAERWAREEVWKAGSAAASKPEVRARAGKSLSATRMAWCPAHLRADYQKLVRTKRLKAADARVIILEQDRMEVERLRNRIAPPPTEPAQVVPRGRPRVWPECPENLQAEYDRLRRKGVASADARAMLEASSCR